MKKHIFYCFLVFSIFLFSACSEDKEPVIDDTSISLDTTSFVLLIDEERTLIATVKSGNTTNNTVIWTSSSEAIATVINGTVTAIEEGEVTITAKVDDKTATCVVTVLEGIRIKGTIWATCNVSAPGVFAAKPEEAGMFYQWNSKVGWPSTGDIGVVIATDGSTTWDRYWKGDYTLPSTSDIWTFVNDPSPSGWRVPTKTEIDSLWKAPSVWTTENGVYGQRFGTAPNTIFLPALGQREDASGNFTYGGTGGYYWGNSVSSGGGNAYYLRFYNGSAVDWSTHSRSYGHFIRCVAR